MEVILHKSEATQKYPRVLLILELYVELLVIFPSIIEMKLCYQTLTFSSSPLSL